MIIILACSEAKHPGPRPAFDKYNSRQFTLLANHIHGLWMARHTVFILSGGYGLVPAHQQIEDYDQKLTPSRVGAFAVQIRDTLRPYDSTEEEVVVYGGKVYRDAIAAATPLPVVELVGENRGCGDHFSELQSFLANLTEEA